MKNVEKKFNQKLHYNTHLKNKSCVYLSKVSNEIIVSEISSKKIKKVIKNTIPENNIKKLSDIHSDPNLDNFSDTLPNLNISSNSKHTKKEEKEDKECKKGNKRENKEEIKKVIKKKLRKM